MFRIWLAVAVTVPAKNKRNRAESECPDVEKNGLTTDEWKEEKLGYEMRNEKRERFDEVW